MSTGQSAASHEGVDLEPHEKDDEVLTMTRRELRIIVHALLDVVAPWSTASDVQQSLAQALKETIQ